MNVDLSPRFATKKIIDGELGSYYSWSSSEFPLLAEAKIGGGKLCLQPRCLALPHYSDCSKLGYVIQGTGGLTGMVFPGESKEKVVKLSKGDVVPVPIGVVSWWFNNGDTELVIVFLGETSKTYVPGEFTYFFVAGALSMLGGFSDEFITRSYNVSSKEASKLLENQNGVMIIKVEDGVTMPEPTNDTGLKLAYKAVTSTRSGIGVSNKKFFGQAGLSATVMKLDAGAVSPPVYVADGAVSLVYVVRGSGRVQIVGLQGKKVLDSEVKAGQMFVVPRLFVAAKLAGEEGMECFSVVTSSEVFLQEFASKVSMWAAFSPQIVEESLKVSPELREKLGDQC